MSKILSRFLPSDRCPAPGPVQMLSLRHLALDALIGTGAHYDGDDVIIEDVVFEADRLKGRVEREIKDLKGQFAFIQEMKNSRVQYFPDRFWRLIDEISVELFDEFNYSDATTTDEEVEWKEYFHNVYEIVVPEENQMYVHQVWEALPQPPNTLVTRPLIRSIQNRFDQLRVEGGKVEALSDILKHQTELGKELINLKKRIAAKTKVLETYYRIIEWSMH